MQDITMDYGSQLALDAYTRLRSTGLRTLMVSVVASISLLWCISKIVVKYRKGLESKDGIDYKAIMGLLQPLIPYVLFIFLLPVIINVVETFLSYMERGAHSILGFESFNLTEELKKEATRDGTPDDPSHWGMDFSYNPLELISSFMDLTASIARFEIKAMIGLIDEWLYTLVLLGRYLWLMLLEITAPIAILMLFMSDEKTNDYKQYFTTWLRNMYSCYMLVIAFMIANTLARFVSEIIWEKYGIETIGSIIVILAIKIFLYSVSSKYSQKLI